MNPEEKASIDFLHQTLHGIAIPKILVVDDNADDVKLLLNELHKFECEVIVASGAEDAIRMIKEDGIDLIFLDLVLPRLPCEDVIEVAAGLIPEASVIIVTGYPDSETKSGAIKKGVKLILQKPLTDVTLSAILHRKLNPPQCEAPTSS